VFKSVGQVVGFRFSHRSFSLTLILQTLLDWYSIGRPENRGDTVSANSQVMPVSPPFPLASHRFSYRSRDCLSAVRNLNNVDVGGRPLRIDLADSDPFLEGKTTVRGELIDGGETRAQWRERENAKRERDKESDSTKDRTFLRNLPQGVPVPPGTSALDMISQTLATMNPTQLVEVLAQFKVRHPWPCLLLVDRSSSSPDVITGICNHPPRPSSVSPRSTSPACICPSFKLYSSTK